MEHPFYGSWGYQTTGYFAPTRRYGDPQDLMALIDRLHRAGIGVILDWVPSHFPSDAFALAQFDGTHLFEHADPRLGFHPDWKSLIFNYGRHEVRSFLASSAEHWLVDVPRRRAARSTRWPPCSTSTTPDIPGSGCPTPTGGRENLEAIAFLRQLNTGIYADHPDVQVFAEESTAFPGVSRPVEPAGSASGSSGTWAGCTTPWSTCARDPVHRPLPPRRAHLPQRVRLQRELHAAALARRGGARQGLAARQDARRRLAALRQPAPALRLPVRPRRARSSSSWATSWRSGTNGTTTAGSTGTCSTGADTTRGAALGGRPATASTAAHRALHELDTDPRGFAWTQPERRRLPGLLELPPALRRRASPSLVVCNFTPVPRHNVLAGVPCGGFWREVLNSDATEYGGSGVGNLGGVDAVPLPNHGMPHTLTLTVPPLAASSSGPQ